MARQIGLPLTGSMDGLSYYRDCRLGYMVRETGGATSKQFRTDKRYAAARAASSEFTHVSRAGKLIREALGEFVTQVKDGTMVNRLNRELVALKELDKTHLRGERRPHVMMTDRVTGKYLSVFQFNDGVKLYHLLEDYPQPEAWNGGVVVKGVRFRPGGCPPEATHAGLTVVRTVIDFEKGCFDTTASRMSVVSLADNNEQDLVLASATADCQPTARAECSRQQGIEFICLQVLFFREENGDLVQLSGKVHGMGVVSTKQIVAGAPIASWRANKRVFAKTVPARARRSRQLRRRSDAPTSRCCDQDLRLRSGSLTSVRVFDSRQLWGRIKKAPRFRGRKILRPWLGESRVVRSDDS